MNFIASIAHRLAGKPLPKPAAVIAQPKPKSRTPDDLAAQRWGAISDVCVYLANDCFKLPQAMDIAREFGLPFTDLIHKLNNHGDAKVTIRAIKRRLRKHERAELSRLAADNLARLPKTNYDEEIRF